MMQFQIYACLTNSIYVTTFYNPYKLEQFFLNTPYKSHNTPLSWSFKPNTKAYDSKFHMICLFPTKLKPQNWFGICMFRYPPRDSYQPYGGKNEPHMPPIQHGPPPALMSRRYDDVAPPGTEQPPVPGLEPSQHFEERYKIKYNSMVWFGLFVLLHVI